MLKIYLFSLVLCGLGGSLQATEPDRVALTCKPVEGTSGLFAPGRVVLLGEMHGTRESPAFVADMVCLAAQAGRAVTVGLEIPVEEEPRIATYLASQGSSVDRDALLKGAFWQDLFQDGRRSQAMLSLLEDLRRLSHQGASLRVVLLDSAVPLPGQERDRAMEKRLETTLAERPKDLFIVLTGDLHTRLARGVPWDAGYEPMGFLLSQNRPGLSLMALDVGYTGGTAWYCDSPEPSSCRTRPVRGSEAMKERGVILRGAIDKDGYNGVYRVGNLQASPPAVPDRQKPASGKTLSPHRSSQ